jgi:translocation and assembly module TamB
VQSLSVKVPVVEIHLESLHLGVDWRELAHRRLHAQDISAGKLDINLLESNKVSSEEPFSMPALPVRVQLDRVALGALNLSVGGEPILLNVQNLQASLKLSDENAALVFKSLELGRDAIQAKIEGELNVFKLADPWPLSVHLKTRAQTSQAESPLCLRNFLPALPAGGKQAAAVSKPVSAKGAAAPKSLAANGGKSRANTASAPSDKAVPASGQEQSGTGPDLCAMDVTADLAGSLDAMSLNVDGDGQDVRFSLNADLQPRKALPVSKAKLDLHLVDGSSLKTVLDVDSTGSGAASRQHVVGSVVADKLNLGKLAGPAIPGALLTSTLDLDAQLRDYKDLLSATVGLNIAEGSRWNGLPASGRIKADIVNVRSQTDSGAAALPAEVGGQAKAGAAPVDRPASGDSVAPPSSASGDMWRGLQLAGLDMNVRLGASRIEGKGALGAPGSQLALTVAAARLADFWPGLPGGLQAQAHLAGTLARHQARLKAVYSPQPGKAQGIGKAPVRLDVEADGGWSGQPPQPLPPAQSGQSGQSTQSGQQPKAAPQSGRALADPAAPSPQPLEGWRGRVLAFSVEHAGLGARLQSPATVSYLPQAVAPAWQWQVGAAALGVKLPLNQTATIRHLGSQGRAGAWETRGAIDHLAMSRRLLAELQKTMALSGKQDGRGGVIVRKDEVNENQQIVYAADWNMKFAGALEGQAHIKRLSGDLIVPGSPDFPLGLQTLSVALNAKPAGEGLSLLTADVNVATAKMGQGKATASALLHSPPGGGFFMDPKDVKKVAVDAEIKDLGWLSILTGDAMDIGGSVQARLTAQSRPDGSWAAGGTVKGQNIRIVRVDDGVRLLDGTLAAHFDGDRFILDSLRFPARLRVTPKEWRTAEWVSSNPDARDGSMTLKGSWSLADMTGAADVELYRYPILQRSDRYAMVTGKLHVDLPPSALSLSGKITADAGWVDLDMLSSVPTLDSDVVVLHKGETQKASAPMAVSMDMEVDLGPRFYITGYGVDSGLVGSMRITMQDGKLTALGALRTRGGAINVYGQHLQLRRGTITFQGDVANPVLNIEALRTGLSVEAGVRVAGTARRPRIDLVSYPDVSDVQKLSWLLLGRGPDDSGGDAALLFSVGTSLISGDEPFYRKFGLDEVSMRSGTLGSTGSILPVETVVRGLDDSDSDIENKFVVASKNLSKGFTISLEQALSEVGTVGRISYQLARGLSADLSIGTVNGIALIYRTFFRD